MPASEQVEKLARQVGRSKPPFRTVGPADEMPPHACMRQYVSKNHRACAVVVLDMPEVIEGDGFRANLRRPVQSPSFTETFGDNMWKV
jgi:hypothetical protein